MLSSNFRKAVLALIIANIIWGAAPPIFKWALVDIGPFTLAFIRFFFGALILLPFVYKNLKVEKQDWQRLALISFFGITVNISFFFIGLKNAPSINAAIIASAAPIFLIFGSVFFLRERPHRKNVIGALVGLMGVLIVLLAPLLKQGVGLAANVAFAGNLFYIVAMLGSLSTPLIGKRLMEKYQPLTIVFWSFLIGSVTFVPFFFNEMSKNHFQIALTTRSEVGIIFGVLFCSVGAYSLLYWSLKYLRAYDVGMFIYLDPLVTVIVAYPLLGEVPDLFFLVGAFLILSGIYVAEGRIHWHPLHLLFRNDDTL